MSARTISGLLFGLALSLTALAQNTPAINPQHPQRYEVVAGDTLWDISARFLRDPWRWKDLWQANPQIKDPNLIYPGDVISLREVNGRLTPTIERGLPVVKLSPQVRTEPLRLAVPTIPVDVIRPFLSRPRVVSEAQFADAPYVVAQADRRLASATGDRIYVRGLHDEGKHIAIRLTRAVTFWVMKPFSSPMPSSSGRAILPPCW